MDVRFNLFTVVHKGLRSALQRLVYSAGRLDIENRRERAAFFAEFKQIATMLHRHALDEDVHIQPLIDRYAPEVGKELEQQHERSEALLSRLEEAAAMLEGAATISANPELLPVWFSFFDDLNRFTGDYFLHLYHEECLAMPCLWKHLDDSSLIAVANKLRSEIPPSVQSIFQRYMIPAMNVQERLTMLTGVKQAAPQKYSREPASWSRIFSLLRNGRN